MSEASRAARVELVTKQVLPKQTTCCSGHRGLTPSDARDDRGFFWFVTSPRGPGTLSTMRRALAGFAILIFALGLYLAIGRRGPDVGLNAAPLSSLARREKVLKPLLEPEASSRSVATGAEPPNEAPATSTVATADAASAIDVRVVVLSRNERLPLGALAVKLAWWDAEKNEPTAQGTTDAAGAVNLRLEMGGVAREPLCTVIVGEGESAKRFNALPVQTELVVLMDACTRLHGQVVIRGVELTNRAWVQAFEPVRGMMSVPVWFGRTEALADGSFEFQACPSREVPRVGVHVDVASVSVTRTIGWEELSSEVGARIEIRFGELTVRVVDESGAPIVGANVRVSPLGDSAPSPAVGTSDARGEFRATLEPGECEVIAAGKELACASKKIQFEAADHPFVVELCLRRLGDRDHLRGHVVHEDGTPIDGALVTASPAVDSDEGAMAAFAQIRTTSDGSFELAIATNRELKAVAFRRDLGVSDELRFVPDGRELELVIRSQGSLEVRVTLPSGMSGFSSGLVEYALVDRRLAYFDHGHESQVPFQLDDVPIGDYNLFVFVAGWNAYAEGSVHVAAGSDRSGDPQSTVLVSHPAQFARGHLRATDGASMIGATLMLDHPTWPPEVEKLWSAKIGDDGHFEMLLGEETACSARLLREGKATNTLQLHAGDSAELVVP